MCVQALGACWVGKILSVVLVCAAGWPTPNIAGARSCNLHYLSAGNGRPFWINSNRLHLVLLSNFNFISQVKKLDKMEATSGSKNAISQLMKCTYSERRKWMDQPPANTSARILEKFIHFSSYGGLMVRIIPITLKYSCLLMLNLFLS